ncbi:kinase-like domain-containing protein [Chytriomyces cf. hyalinus JEL632]|nr:kinase-like domain-containing protein [Chytriomyces cf. hyalinus JEL632]
MDSDYEQSGKDVRIASLWDGMGSIVKRTYKHRSSGDSISVMVKTIAPKKPASRPTESFQRKIISYQVERYFYSIMNQLVPLPVEPCMFRLARLYASAPTVLFMEDLSVVYPDSMSGLVTEVEAKAALKWFANLHGYFMGSSSSQSHPQRSMTETTSTEEGVWDQGSYWLDKDWQQLGRRVDELLASIPVELTTLIHGDAKTENCLLNHALLDSDGLPAIAFYDFQYVGYGSGMKDVVYFLATSIDWLDEKAETELLDWYFTCLIRVLKQKGSVWKTFTKEVMMDQFELCMVDWLRFMKGWGLWGNASYVQRRVSKIRKSRGW